MDCVTADLKILQDSKMLMRILVLNEKHIENKLETVDLNEKQIMNINKAKCIYKFWAMFDG